MKLYKIITIKDEKGCDTEKSIYELSESEISDYKLIGSAAGPSLEICFFEGQKHAKNFWNRLVGFRIRETEISKMLDNAFQKLKPFSKVNNIGVDFYEKKKEAVGKLNLGELRNELSKYQYEWKLDDIILLFQESMRRKGEKVSAEKLEETIIRFWTEWESSGSPMGYNRGEQIKKNKETGKVFAIVEYDDLEGITLRTHLSWLFLLYSLYEEYKWSRKRAEEPKA